MVVKATNSVASCLHSPFYLFPNSVFTQTTNMAAVCYWVQPSERSTFVFVFALLTGGRLRRREWYHHSTLPFVFLSNLYIVPLLFIGL